MRSATLLSLLFAMALFSMASAFASGKNAPPVANGNKGSNSAQKNQQHDGGLRGWSRRRGLGHHKGPKYVQGQIKSDEPLEKPKVAHISESELREEEKMKKRAHGHKEKKVNRRHDHHGQGAEKLINTDQYSEVGGYARQKGHAKKERAKKYKPKKEEKAAKPDKMKPEKATKPDKMFPAPDDDVARVPPSLTGTELVSEWPPTPSPVDAYTKPFIAEGAAATLASTSTPASSVPAADALTVLPATEEPGVLPTPTAPWNYTSTEGSVATVTIADAPGFTTDVITPTSTTEAPIVATPTTSTATTLVTTTTTTIIEGDDLPEGNDNPTFSPTYSPTHLTPCPRTYDPSKISYVLGENVEVREHLFQCEIEYYCNIAEWDEALLENDPNAKEDWNGAWVHVGPCAPSTLVELLELEAEEEEDWDDDTEWDDNMEWEDDTVDS